MLPEHLRLELAAQEVAKILKLNWETLTRGNRAKCFHIVRAVDAVMNGRFTPGEGIQIKDPGDAQ